MRAVSASAVPAQTERGARDRQRGGRPFSDRPRPWPAWRQWRTPLLSPPPSSGFAASSPWPFPPRLQRREPTAKTGTGTKTAQNGAISVSPELTALPFSGDKATRRPSTADSFRLPRATPHHRALAAWRAREQATAAGNGSRQRGARARLMDVQRVNWDNRALFVACRLC
jgi:hypothetical protein